MKSTLLSLAIVGQAMAIPALRGFSTNEEVARRNYPIYSSSEYPTASTPAYDSYPTLPKPSKSTDVPVYPTGHSKPTGSLYPTGSHTSHTPSSSVTHTATRPADTTLTRTSIGYTTVCKTHTGFVPTSTVIGSSAGTTYYSTYLSVSYSTWYEPSTTTEYEVIVPSATGHELYPTGETSECASAVTVYIPATTIYSTVYATVEPSISSSGHGESHYSSHIEEPPVETSTKTRTYYPTGTGGHSSGYPKPTGTASSASHPVTGYPVYPTTAWHALV